MKRHEMWKFTSVLFSVLLTGSLYAQSAHLAMIADPTDDSGARFVKVANNSGSNIDMTDWYLIRWTNGNTEPTSSSQFYLTNYGTLYDGGCIYIAASASDFEAAYGFAPDFVAGSSGVAGSNGDDQIALYNAAGVIADFFGVIGEDGSNTCHEFEDGYALRTTTAPDGEFWNGANWTIYCDGSDATDCFDHNPGQEQTAADIALLVAECTLDGIDIGGCMDEAATNYNSNVTFDDGSCEYPTEVTISAIQQDMGADDDGTYNGQTVIVRGIVTGAYGSNTSIQDGEGAWSGIFVYVGGGLFDDATQVAMGDSVIVEGVVGSYNGGTQLTSATASILNSGNALPAPAVISTADANLEEYEGVLCQITGAIVGEPNNFGEFPIDDGSGSHGVDDMGYDGYTEQGAMLGDVFRVTGAINGGFGNSIEPRNADDFQKLGCTNPAANNYDAGAIIDDDSCEVVDGAISIATIQQGQALDPAVFTDSLVTVSGIVTGVYGTLFSLQEGTGEYSGMFGFGPEVAVAQGDFVALTGVVSEFFGVTQIQGVGENLLVTNIISQGNDLPAAEALGTAAAYSEEWEGVLIQCTGTVTSPDLGNGEWGIDDGTGEVRIDDRGWDHQATGEVVINAQFQVTGPLHYGFGDFKLIPRSADDVLLYGCTFPSAENYDMAADIDDGSCIGSEPCDLFFSEYAEGSSHNKYLEIYNPTNGPVSLALYSLANQSNGANNTDANDQQWDYWNEFSTGASIEAGETYLVVSSAAQSALLDSADATLPSSYFFNGNDAWALIRSEVSSFGNDGDWTLIDVVGDPYGANPGSGWEVAGNGNATQNNTLRRKPQVSFGNGGDWAASAGTTAEDSEWIVLANDYALNNALEGYNSHEFSGLCAENNGGCTDPFAINYNPSATEDDGSCIFIPTLTIQEVRTAVEPLGLVKTSGVVTGVFVADSTDDNGWDYPIGNKSVFSIQNGQGEFSGIWVRGEGPTLESIFSVAVGDEVEITGVPGDLYGVAFFDTPIVTIISNGNTVPQAEVLNTQAVNQDAWEGALVSVLGEVTDAGNQFNEWKIDDGQLLDPDVSASSCVINDLGHEAISTGIVELGAQIRVVGPLGYSFSKFKVEPRSASDVTRLGCTDPAYPNYDALAEEDNGTCASVEGCTDPAADNYDPEATLDDGSCLITGCDDPEALNYQENATVIDNSLCYYTLPNILINEIHYHPCESQGSDFDWEFVEFYNAGEEAALGGYEVWFAFSNPELLSLAMTFPEDAVVPAGSYFLVVPGAVAQNTYSGMGITSYLMEDGNLGNGGGTVVLQDSFANVVDSITYDDASPWPSDEVVLLGNVLVASPDGGCSSLELIQTDLDNGDTNNWQASWEENGTPGAANSSAYGCTDGAACNYSAIALFADESCTYDCYGCTYPEATNYDETASFDDGTCEVTAENNCPTDLNGDGTTSVSDLLMLLGAFATDCEE